MTQKEIVKTIKRINERLAVYQRQGLTDSERYNRIVKKIELLEIPFSDTKGRFKISLKKSDLVKIDTEDLKTLDSMPTLKQERQLAKEMGYKTTKEQNEYIKTRGSFIKWIEDNAEVLYQDAMSGTSSAKQLESLLKEKGKGQGVRNVDYNKVFSLIEKYEKAKERERQLLHDSNFHNNDSEFFNDIHGD